MGTLLLCMPDILARHYISCFATFWSRHYIKHSRVGINNQAVFNRTNPWKVFRYFSGSSLLLAVLPASAQERELLLADGQQLFIDNGCFSCHTVGGSGNATGPDLSHVGARYDEDGLAGWLRTPARHKLPVHTQKFQHLTRGQVEQLAAYLSSLR